MSRPIKFRVWDKDYKEMHVCGENVHDSMSFNEDGTAYYYNLQNGEGSGEHGSYILMQYTGRNTYEEQEIFDSDILYFTVFDYNGSDKQYKGVVKWSDEASAFVISVDKSNEEYWLYWVLNQDDEVEVIGNIHDHPHLLGDDKDGQ